MALAYLGLAQGVPLVVFQLFGGVLADRTNRLRLLIVTRCLTAAVLAAAFLLAVLGWVRVGHLLVLAALSNIFRAFDEPARLAPIPQLIDRARLPNAIALGSIPHDRAVGRRHPDRSLRRRGGLRAGGRRLARRPGTLQSATGARQHADQRRPPPPDLRPPPLPPLSQPWKSGEPGAGARGCPSASPGLC
jgi:hypothetical protein